MDRARNALGRMKMCHMLADTLEELHAMADAIGMKRAWFQAGSTPHYDVTQTRRELAVKLGAVEIGRAKLVELIRDWRSRRNPTGPDGGTK